MEEVKEESYNFLGIKETEQTDSPQTKPVVVSGCEKDSMEIPEIKERNCNLGLSSSNNEISLNGGNKVLTTKLDNIAEDNTEVMAASPLTEVNNYNSKPESVNTMIETSEIPKYGLSEVDIADFNMKSIPEAPEEGAKMGDEMFGDKHCTEKLLPKDTLRMNDQKVECGTSLENDVKSLFAGTDSESMKNPINGSPVVHESNEEKKTVDRDEDTNKINDHNTVVESFLQENIAEIDVFHTKENLDDTKHEDGNEKNLKENTLNLMDEKSEEINSFACGEDPISVNIQNEKHNLNKEILKADNILKNESSKSRELASEGNDQMDGDQGSVEIDFMVGDDDDEDQEDIPEGNEIDSEEEEEEEKSEFVEDGHETSIEFHPHQLSEKVGLQAIEEHVGQPIEFKVKETRDEIESKFNERPVEPNETKDLNFEIQQKDANIKANLLKGNLKTGKSEIYSEAAVADKAEIKASDEGRPSKSATADIERRRTSFESQLATTDNKAVLQESTNSSSLEAQFATVDLATEIDRRDSRTSLVDVEESKSDDMIKKSSKKDAIPDMLPYRKPSKHEIVSGLNEQIPEATKIGLREEQIEEDKKIRDTKPSSAGDDISAAALEESKLTLSHTRQIRTKEAENQSKLEDVVEENKIRKSSFHISQDSPTKSSELSLERKNSEVKSGISPIGETRELPTDSLLLQEETKIKDSDKKAVIDEKLAIVTSQQSLVQQENIKKMQLPVKSVVITSVEAKKSTKSRGKTLKKKEADNDSGVDETTQAKVETKKNVPTTLKGIPRKQQVITSPTKRLPSPAKALVSPVKQMASARTPLSPSGQKFNQKTPTLEQKKLPMNKIVVGQAASPNLKEVKSKIGSMTNVTHRPGGGAIKVESKQLDFSQTKSKVGALNANYKPGGGDKKQVESKKLEWNAKSKIGSLENARHKPGGGEKKIETVKLDFKDKATSKVGSTANIKHQPGGGKLQIEDHKLSFKESAKSKVGSLDNVTHKPGGGTIVIYDDCRRQASQSNSESQSPCQSVSPGPQNGLTPTSIEGIPE